MNLNAQLFIYLDGFAFLLLSGLFFLLFKSNKWFQRSKAVSSKDDWIMYIKCLLLSIIFFGLIVPSKAGPRRMFNVPDTCARYRLKEKTAQVAIKDLKLKYEGKEGSEADLFIKLYCSAFDSK